MITIAITPAKIGRSMKNRDSNASRPLSHAGGLDRVDGRPRLDRLGPFHDHAIAAFEA
jgi:hypothetical protein